LTSYGSVLSLLSPSSLICYPRTHSTIPSKDQPDFVHRKDKINLVSTPGQLCVFNAGLIHRGAGREEKMIDSRPNTATNNAIEEGGGGGGEEEYSEGDMNGNSSSVATRRVRMAICDGCNPDPKRDPTIVDDPKVSRFNFCLTCEEKLDTVRAHFYMEGYAFGSGKRPKESRKSGSRGDMNILECDGDCKLCGPVTNEPPRKMYASDFPPPTSPLNSNSNSNGAFIAGGDLEKEGFVIIDLNDKNICNLKNVNLPEVSE